MTDSIDALEGRLKAHGGAPSVVYVTEAFRERMLDDARLRMTTAGLAVARTPEGYVGTFRGVRLEVSEVMPKGVLATILPSAYGGAPTLLVDGDYEGRTEHERKEDGENQED